MERKMSKMVAVFASVVLALAVVPTVLSAGALAEEQGIEVGGSSQIEIETPETGVSSQSDDECPKGGEHAWEQRVQKATFGKDGCVYGVCTKCGLDGREVGQVMPIVPITKVKLSTSTYTYTGKACKPKVKVYTYDGQMSADQYKVTYSNNVNAGQKTAVAKVTLTSDYYEGTKKLKFTILPAENTLTVTGKTATVAYKRVKKANVVLQCSDVLTVKNAQGSVTYKKKSGDEGITISKTGTVTVKKGTSKGTYKVKVKVTAAGNNNYNKVTKVVSFKVVVA